MECMMMKWILVLVLMGARSLHAETGNPASAMTAADVAADADSTNGWGYGYDSLLRDLDEWRENPFVSVDSIGASVKGRAIWMVTVTDSTDSLGLPGEPETRKRRVFMHARTHPAEVQAQYVTNESIRYLLDSGENARKLRREFIWNFVPMYNPDGVEEGHDRFNAHIVDLEGNWDKGVLEPEVTALKITFEAMMKGPNPIEVAINMHSDQYNCTRFFFFHNAAGTSAAYEELQRKFIGGVQSHFPNGIEDWDFVRSWGNGTQARYPEGFWWLEHKEAVLALTYEDTNCPNAGRYDSTGIALIRGSADYVRERIVAAVRLVAASRETRMLLLPEGVRVPLASATTRWELSDLRGRTLAHGGFNAGETLLAWSRLPAGPGRILSVFGGSGAPSRVRLPNRLD
jgi:hypothetical protein